MDATIRQVVDSYCHLRDDGAFERVAPVFAERGILEISGAELAGRDSISTWFGTHRVAEPAGEAPHDQHGYFLRGDTAHVETDFVFLRILGLAIDTAFVGRSMIDLERLDFRWLIGRRVVVRSD